MIFVCLVVEYKQKHKSIIISFVLVTIETLLFHSSNVLIKIQKNVFKRIQTTINDY